MSADRKHVQVVAVRHVWGLTQEEVDRLTVAEFGDLARNAWIEMKYGGKPEALRWVQLDRCYGIVRRVREAAS